MLICLLFLGGVLIVRAVNQELEIARMKSAFVSLVSHEFKSPIASMRTLVERLHAGSVNDPVRMQLYFVVVAVDLLYLFPLVTICTYFSKLIPGFMHRSFEKT